MLLVPLPRGPTLATSRTFEEEERKWMVSLITSWPPQETYKTEHQTEHGGDDASFYLIPDTPTLQETTCTPPAQPTSCVCLARMNDDDGTEEDDDDDDLSTPLPT
jgi:hypothetical protein